MNEYSNMDSQPCAGQEMHCNDLMDVLYEYVDGGCDDNIRALLQQHIDQCPGCLEQLGIEMQVRELLRSRCAQQAPQGLRTRITTELRVQYRYRCEGR